MSLQIRDITEDDAQAYIDLRLLLDSETDFMLCESGERKMDSEKTRAMIAALPGSGHHILLAFNNNELVGYITCYKKLFNRDGHRAGLGMGIKKTYWHRGIATRLFEQLEAELRAQPEVAHLELTVVSHNQRAIALYKKWGFVIEGTKKHAIKIADHYYDEICMAKYYGTGAHD